MIQYLAYGKCHLSICEKVNIYILKVLQFITMQLDHILVFEDLYIRNKEQTSLTWAKVTIKITRKDKMHHSTLAIKIKSILPQGWCDVSTNCLGYTRAVNIDLARILRNLNIYCRTVLLNTTSIQLRSIFWYVSTMCYGIQEDVCLLATLIGSLDFICPCIHSATFEGKFIV